MIFFCFGCEITGEIAPGLGYQITSARAASPVLSRWAERDLREVLQNGSSSTEESVGDGPSDGANSVPIYSEELAVDITGTQTYVETQCR